MEDRGGGAGGSFVAVRRISQGLDKTNACQTTQAEVVAGSAAWLDQTNTNFSRSISNIPKTSPWQNILSGIITKTKLTITKVVDRIRIASGRGGDKNTSLIYKKTNEAFLNNKEKPPVTYNLILPPEEPRSVTLVEKIYDRISWRLVVAVSLVSAGAIFLALRLRGNDAPQQHPPEQHVAQELAEVVAGSAACPSFDLTPAQGDCFMKLQNRLDIAYDSSLPEHQEALRALWKAAFPEEELRGLITEQWKEMGWQGKDPSTDFRGGGFISLENLLYFARNFPKSFQDLVRKQEGDRSMAEFPFAVAGVNITIMLIQMLDLKAVKPQTIAGTTFLKFLSDDESVFDVLYCIAFKLMDHQWLMKHASYTDFNAVMESTRHQLESELLKEGITRVEELPSYALLKR